MTKFFRKCKISYFGDILSAFSLNLGKNEFSWKKGSVSFQIFQLSTIMQKSEKANEKECYNIFQKYHLLYMRISESPY